LIFTAIGPMDGQGVDMTIQGTWRASGRRWLSRASNQLLVVGGLGVVLALVVVGVNVAALNRVDAQFQRVNQSLRPASEDLEAVSGHLAAEQAAVLSLRPTTDVQTLDLTNLREATANADASWRAYVAHSAGLPGEARPRVAYESAYRKYQSLQLNAIGARLATTPAAAAATASTTASAYEVAYADSQSALSKLVDQYERAANSNTIQGASRVRSMRARVIEISILGLLLFGSAFTTVFVLLRRREARMRAQEHRYELERERSRLEGELQQAFDMVNNEPDAYAVIGSALSESGVGHHAELLLADSSRAHFRQVVTNSDPQHSGCGVGDPRQCPATSQTRTLVFETSNRIAACPHLRDRPEGPCSAVCVPVTIAGKSIGVLHSTGPDGVAPDANVVETLALIGRKSGDRLGTLRAFAKTEAQARTDPLTGLLNRRSLENQVQDLIEDGHSYVVAYGDVDYFKHLNDLHGHDTGDRALRLFSRVLRDSVRPTDLPARYGGEEFVVVLPDCGVDAAVAVVERVREQLAIHLSDGQLPAFTVSFGVADSSASLLFSETLENADQALLQAKSEGRNRVVAAPSIGSSTSSPSPVDGPGPSLGVVAAADG
jgi:diguanylate cyclase (GGDEF)-like protein